jgi:serine/threonine protein kinase
MGAVWAARHLPLRSLVAVKLIDSTHASDPNALARFEREAHAAAMLRSAHVVQVLDFGVDEGSPYLVMELLQGQSLAARLAERGRLPPEETWTIVSHVASAMSRAHARGIVHRDLKPDNVFLVDEGEELVAKVLDFGVAKVLLDPTQALTDSGVLVGTPRYSSPEQLEARPIDARSDLFSLGVMTFECVTGLRPFDSSSMPALLRAICYDPVVVPSRVARVPVGFDEWFARASSRDPAARFQTAKEFVDGLRPLLGPGSPVPTIGPLDDGAPRWKPRTSDPPVEETYLCPVGERRGEARVPSSIPAGIDRMRDLHHVAVIQNASRGGALLVTRHACTVGQCLVLSLHTEDAQQGDTFAARVVRVAPLAGSIWEFEVGVQFLETLPDELFARVQVGVAVSRC